MTSQKRSFGTEQATPRPRLSGVAALRTISQGRWRLQVEGPDRASGVAVDQSQ